MKLFFITKENTDLANDDSRMLMKTRQAFLRMSSVQETLNPDESDFMIIQEKWSFKDFRYTEVLMKDPFLSKYLNKLFTLNFDDWATGLLRGLYTNIPKSRFNSSLHASVPYMAYFNEFVFANNIQPKDPEYLASWRGNSKSHNMRPKMIKALTGQSDCKIEQTDSWMNHSSEEKKNYIRLILNSKFSLCPAGWSPPSLRIYESMALGVCPVIISNDFEPPEGPEWHEFALFYPDNKLQNLHDFLLANESKYEYLGRKAKETWNQYYCENVLPEFYAKSFLRLFHLSSEIKFDSELKRWKSFDFYWRNHWTFPQRIANKIMKMIT